MSFIALANSVRWTKESPAIYVSYAYEKERAGADMRYRARVTVNAIGSSSSFGYPIYAQVTINGSSAGSATMKAASPSRWTSALVYTTGWITVPNKSSGTTPISFRIYSGSGSSRNQTNSYSMEIDPGASSVSLSAESVEIGSSVTATVTPYIEGVTHKLTWSLADSEYSTTVDIGSASTYAFTIPAEWTNGMPNSVTGTITCTAETVNGTTSIGTNSASCSVTVPDTVVPTITSATLTLTNGFGIYALQNRTSGKITVNASGAYGSSLVTCVATGIGTSVTNEITLPVFQTPGTVTINVYVTDTRGRRSIDYPVTVQVFSNDNPTLTASATRCLADGTPDTDGMYLNVYPVFTCVNIGGTNTVIAKEKHRKAGTTVWSAETTLTSGTVSIIGNNSISQADDWEVEITATDTKGTSTVVDINVPKSFRLANWNGPISSFAIGRMASKANTFQVALKTEFEKDVELIGDIKKNGQLYVPEIMPISRGGTGADNAASAIANLGITDYIVAEGDSGIWHYRKWNSGKAECIGTTTLTSPVQRSWGSIYISGNSSGGQYSPSVNYPFEFVEVPTVIATPAITNQEFSFFVLYEGTKMACPQYQAFRGATATALLWGATMHVVGKWK